MAAAILRVAVTAAEEPEASPGLRRGGIPLSRYPDIPGETGEQV